MLCARLNPVARIPWAPSTVQILKVTLIVTFETNAISIASSIYALLMTMKSFNEYKKVLKKRVGKLITAIDITQSYHLLLICLVMPSILQ